MYGSRTSAMRAGSGMSLGAWTSISSPFVSVTSKPTDGIVASRSRSYSRSRRSRTMSMCSSPRKPHAEAEPERVGRLGLPGQRGVVERELLERVAEVGVVVGVDREDAAEDHRLDLAVAGHRLGRALLAFVVSVSPTRSFVTSLMPVMRKPTSPACSSSARLIAGVKKPMSSMSASVPAAIARIASPFLKTPSTTRM